MKILLVLALLFTSNLLFAKSCLKYNTTSTPTVVSWTAFKTPLKIGVGGRFNKVVVTTKSKTGSLSKILTGAKFNIDSKSVDTSNSSRDLKIVSTFFKDISISGSITKVKKGRIFLT